MKGAIIGILLLIAIISGVIFGITQIKLFLILFGIAAIPLFAFGLISIVYAWIINPISAIIKKRKK
jgi:hypothetical protein